MKLSTLPPDTLKTFASILQQKVMLANAHQKASSALANFEIAVGSEERYIEMSVKEKEKTRKALRGSVSLVADSIKVIDQLEVA